MNRMNEEKNKTDYIKFVKMFSLVFTVASFVGSLVAIILNLESYYTSFSMNTWIGFSLLVFVVLYDAIRNRGGNKDE